ncbi:MAG: PAS-domain containing protein [Holosporaceae bacterium]|jgi:signal transduction histidine kinase/PAS domain-containing protein|nr:PAS-domain containing protein [Holosporaceae bacterium]
MKTWSGADLVGFILTVFGMAAFIFSNSGFLVSISLLIASLILLSSVYGARYSSVKYLNVLCHYQAVLSSSADGWVAWNADDRCAGASKKLKVLLGLTQGGDVRFADILAVLDPEDADELALRFNRLKKAGLNFELIVKAGNNKLKINGSRMIINNVETMLLWCADITATSSLIDSLKEKAAVSREEARHLSEILNTLPIPIWRRNEKLAVTYCNRAYANHTDSAIDKVLADNIPLVPGNLFGQGHSLAENAKKCNRMQSISHFITVNGIRKKISVHECPIAEGHIVGYANDITAEEALTVNLDRITAANCEVLENLSAAIIIFGENTRVSFFNSAYQRLMKLESVWLHSKPAYGEVLDELRNNRCLSEHADYQAFKKAGLAMFTSITAPVRELIYLPSGKTLRLVISPYPLGGLLFVYEDVTDSLDLQRKNNTLLAVQNETINNLYEGIMVYGSNNRLKIINTAMHKIWKFNNTAAADLKGSHITETLDLIKDELDYGSNWEEFRENAVSNLTDRIVKNGKLVKKDGSVIMFSYVPLPDGAHMYSFIDITDTCMVENAVMEKNQALKAAQDLRFEFISGVSVELKDPLNALLGFSDLLLHQYFGILNEKQLEYCRCISDAAEQLHQLINNLLEMVSIDAESANLDISEFSMSEAMDEVIDSLEKRINEKNLNIVRNYPKRIVFSGDKTRIKQSFYGILTSAVRSARHCGRIDVTMTNDDEGALKIIVKDDGEGLREDKSYGIFKRSAGKISSGSDVGTNNLSMPFVKSLVERHGGTLKISSNFVEGTRVVCTLPVKPEISYAQLQNSDTAEEEKVVNSQHEEFRKQTAGRNRLLRN